MKRNCILFSFVVALTHFLSYGKEYKYLDLLHSRKVPMACNQVQPAFLLRGKQEKGCDFLDDRAKKILAREIKPEYLMPYSGGWGIVEYMVNSNRFSKEIDALKDILGENCKEEDFTEFYRLMHFLMEQ